MAEEQKKPRKPRKKKEAREVYGAADGIPTKMTADVTAWMSLPMPYEWGRKE